MLELLPAVWVLVDGHGAALLADYVVHGGVDLQRLPDVGGAAVAGPAVVLLSVVLIQGAAGVGFQLMHDAVGVGPRETTA